MSSESKPSSLPKHPITGVQMRYCPSCGRPSGLTGIDGKNCLAWYDANRVGGVTMTDYGHPTANGKPWQHPEDPVRVLRVLRGLPSIPPLPLHGSPSAFSC